jgi:hypothetical protein
MSLIKISEDLVDANATAGCTHAAMLVPVLKQCGANLSRENMMKQAIHQMQLARFNGKSWELSGEIMEA